MHPTLQTWDNPETPQERSGLAEWAQLQTDMTKRFLERPPFRPSGKKRPTVETAGRLLLSTSSRWFFCACACACACALCSYLHSLNLNLDLYLALSSSLPFGPVLLDRMSLAAHGDRSAPRVSAGVRINGIFYCPGACSRATRRNRHPTGRIGRGPTTITACGHADATCATGSGIRRAGRGQRVGAGIAARRWRWRS